MIMMMMIVLDSESLKEFKIVKIPLIYFLLWTEETHVHSFHGSLC